MSEAIRKYASELFKGPEVKMAPEEKKPLRLIQSREIEETQQDYNIIMAQYIRQSEALRREINIGTKKGEDITVLYNKALKCISLMTGDQVFYNQNKI